MICDKYMVLKNRGLCHGYLFNYYYVLLVVSKIHKAHDYYLFFRLSVFVFSPVNYQRINIKFDHMTECINK